MTTPRDLVKQTLEFKNPERVPRQLWALPWAAIHHTEKLKLIESTFPDDILQVTAPGAFTSEGSTTKLDGSVSNAFEPGIHIDAWGCIFTNIHRGLIGEVKEAQLQDEDWLDDHKLVPPEQALNINIPVINKICANTDKFVVAGDWARPFERLQFLRGTEQLFMDLVLRPERMYSNFQKVHDFYCKLITEWCKTDVDAVFFMDDWGSQKSLLIHPNHWIEFFKPMYKEYVEIAHKHNKKIFMHSDGNILEIIPHLIEIGLDAINAQLFCMGVQNLEKYKGHITFWGEIDRQHLLPNGTENEIKEAVELVRSTLWQNGGCIAQCEFGAGANPDNVYTVFDTWNKGNI